jgi:peptidoglycan hydrolase-like protein with peptidoglycan-binding domain
MDTLTYYYLENFNETSNVPLEIVLKNLKKTLKENFNLLIKLNQKQFKNIKLLNVVSFLCALSLIGVTSGIVSNKVNARVLKKGDQGADVMALQKALQLQGSFPATGNLTDYYGTTTEEAVRKFQQNNGLTVDGIAGEITKLNLLEKISEEEAEALLNQTKTTVDNTVTGNLNQNTTENVSPAPTSESQDKTENNIDSSPLKKGDEGDQVKKLQEALKKQGFFPSNQQPTAYYGPITENAVKEFQKSKGLPVNGIAEEATQQLLFNPSPQNTPTQTSIPENQTTSNETDGNFTVLKLGQKGDKIKQLQELLKAKGYFPKNTQTTFYYGPITENAVKKFQQDQGLKADGMVGKNTWDKLINSPVKPSENVPLTTSETSNNTTTNTNNNNIDISLKAQADINLCRRISIPSGGYLVIRLYPSSNAEEVDLLTNGTKVGIKNLGNDGWVPLMEGGYVSSKYLKSC